MKNNTAGIVINTCDRPRPLKRLVNNVYDQKRECDAVVVVNDGEKDNLPELPDETHIIQHNKDYYALASGRNRGWRKAQDLGKDYAIFYDDDMVLEHKCLSEFFKAFDDGYKFLKGKITNRKTGAMDLRFAGDMKALQLRPNEEDKWAEMVEEGKLSYGGSNIAMEINILDEVDGWDEDFDGNWGWEDRDVTWRLYNKGYRVKMLLDAMVTHMELSITGDYRRMNGENYYLFVDKHPDFTKERKMHGER